MALHFSVIFLYSIFLSSFLWKRGKCKKNPALFAHCCISILFYLNSNSKFSTQPEFVAQTMMTSIIPNKASMMAPTNSSNFTEISPHSQADLSSPDGPLPVRQRTQPPLGGSEDGVFHFPATAPSKDIPRRDPKTDFSPSNTSEEL